MFCHPILTTALQELSPHFIDEDIKAGRGLRSGLKWLAHVEELGGSRGFRGLSFCPGRGTHTEVSPFFLQTSVSSPVDGGPSLAFPSGTKEFKGGLSPDHKAHGAKLGRSRHREVWKGRGLRG